MDRIYVMQLVRSFQVGAIDRRTFLKRAGAAVGSLAAANLLLAACQPVTAPPREVLEATPSGEGVGSAATNQTTAAGLVAGPVEYPGPDGEVLTGYLARPEGTGPWPALIVLQEWWGLNEHIMDVARRFALEGYVVLAPDLYKGQVATEPNEARKLVMELDMAAAVEEIQSGIDYLLAQETVAGEQVGVTGFCMGGRLALADGAGRCRCGAGGRGRTLLWTAAHARRGGTGDSADPGSLRRGGPGHSGGRHQGHAGCTHGGWGRERVPDLCRCAPRVF